MCVWENQQKCGIEVGNIKVQQEQRQEEMMKTTGHLKLHHHFGCEWPYKNPSFSSSLEYVYIIQA